MWIGSYETRFPQWVSPLQETKIWPLCLEWLKRGTYVVQIARLSCFLGGIFQSQPCEIYVLAVSRDEGLDELRVYLFERLD